MTNHSFACTTLAIKDKVNNLYRGRTLEFFTTEVSLNLIYYPKDYLFHFPSPENESSGLNLTVKIPYIGICFQFELNNNIKSYYSIEGVNTEGLSYSMNMLRDSVLLPLNKEDYDKSLPILAIGDWALSQFKTVEEIRKNINKVAFWSPIISNFDNINSPFHYAFYDSLGDCIVIQITNGVLTIKDNPTYCLTNDPRLEWHLINLNNYTHLDNINVSSSNLGNLKIEQPDSGIATVSLPSSDTSVDRFIRAVYYTSFYKKHFSPDKQLIELSHIMNNFDRPKYITMDIDENHNISSEYTLWTSLIDVSRGLIYLRKYDELNYKKFTFDEFKDKDTIISIEI